MLPPCTIFLFGATGDLARQKLIPALYLLHGRLHEQTRIVAIGRKEYTPKSLAKEYQEHVKPGKDWAAFIKRILYHKLEFHDGNAYDALLKLAQELPENRIFYLATPQDAFPLVIRHLSRTGLAAKRPEQGWHRIVFEKPFGSDLRSARALNKEVTRLFSEEQIYRIDHYLGKSFVQEILVLRFANPLFEFNWSSKYIDRVEIIVSEDRGIGTRGAYYDSAGAIRDMVQNHLLQLMSLVAMEPPSSMHAEDIRDRKIAVLKDIRLQGRRELRESLLCGQYGEGSIGGKYVPGYRAEAGVRPDSTAETYVMARLEVRNSRWKGTPFYLVTGKALRRKYAEIAIHFRKGSWLHFPTTHGAVEENVMVIRIQPDEGLQIRFNLADNAGTSIVTPHLLDFSHKALAHYNTQESYELLLGEVMRGDHTLFTRWDFVERAWEIADNLRSGISEVHSYPAGSDGPAVAESILRHDHGGK